MTDKIVYWLFGEAKEYADVDAYVSDMLLSSVLAPDEDADVDMALAPQLQALWRTANAPFRALLVDMGLTQTQCATRFCIPLRTVQGWVLEERSAPPYLRLMMAELTGLLTIRDQ